MCDEVPSTLSTASCKVLWNGTAPIDDVTAAGVSSINSTLQTILNTVMDSASLSVPVSTSSASGFTSAVTSVSAVASARATQTSPVQEKTTTASKPNSDVDAAAAGPTKTLTVIAIVPSSSANLVDTDEYYHDNAEFTTFRKVCACYNLFAEKFIEISLQRKDANLGTIDATEVNGQLQVNITGLDYNDQPVTVDRTCLLALNYPVEMYVCIVIDCTPI